MALEVAAVSDMAETKLPPIDRNTLALLSFIANTELTASRPGLFGGLMPIELRIASKNPAEGL
jgi:hypothetical protein